MAVIWTDPPMYIDPAIVSAPDWNLALRDNQIFLRTFRAFRFYFGAFGGFGQPNLTQDFQSVGATSGRWRLSYNGVFTPYLNYNATNAEVQSALLTLTGFCHPSKFTCIPTFTLNGTSLQTGFQIVFNGAYWQTTIQVLGKDDSLLIGDVITITVEGVTGDKIEIGFQNDPTIPGGQGSPVGMEPGVWWFNCMLTVAPFTSNYNFWIVVNNQKVVAHTFVGSSGGIERAFWLRGYTRIADGDVVGVFADKVISPIQGTPYTYFEGSWEGA